MNIQRHPADWNAFGLTDKFAGKVIYCIDGSKLYIGMSLQNVVASYKKQFGKQPPSLKHTGSWLHQMSLEEILETGFYCLVMKGDILVIPPGFVVHDACLGNEGADIVSWLCVVPGGAQWLKTYRWAKANGVLSLPQKADDQLRQIYAHLGKGAMFMEKLMLLSDVKSEEEKTAEPEVDANAGLPVLSFVLSFVLAVSGFVQGLASSNFL